MSQPQSNYKPSPLSFNSPRTSPFRRPESPSSPSTTIRASTPTYQSTRPSTPSKLANASTLSGEAVYAQRADTRRPSSAARKEDDNGTGTAVSTTMEGHATTAKPTHSPSRAANQYSTALFSSSPTVHQHSTTNVDALSRLPPAQAREMREAFQILDRDNDGLVDHDDVEDMLTSLGLNPNSSQTAAYLPASTPHPLSLPAYLAILSSLLSPLSPSNELLAAMSAFDDDDSGQVDVEELLDAVTNARPDNGARGISRKEAEAVMDGFVGRRAFGGKGNSKGDIFRYREWVAGLGAVGDGAKAGV